MKCNCFIKRTTVKKRETIDYRSWWHTDLGPFPNAESHADLLKNGYTVCDGRVKANICAQEEPYFGGSSAVLEVSYACTSCHNTFYPHLPTDDEELGFFLTDLIAGFADYDALVAKRLAAEIEANRQRDIAITALNARKSARQK